MPSTAAIFLEMICSGGLFGVPSYKKTAESSSQQNDKPVPAKGAWQRNESLRSRAARYVIR
ncbi:hypothetical protein LJC40_05755 [Synergistaceae bacterium OttesenSCG-928-D05]|nr:hypothetical protein [Synergistaceae bacterium OttesenSCG-928-D05]